MTRQYRIDTTESAIITEAASFPPEATTPDKDSTRQGRYPLRVYEGYNFLPTDYGYKSYFGMETELSAEGLVSPDDKELVVEDIFVYQTRAFINVLVALTSHGIYIRTQQNWHRILELDAPEEEGTSLPWHRVTLVHLLFLYRQGGQHVYVLDDIVDGEGTSMDIFNGMQVEPHRVDVGAPEEEEEEEEDTVSTQPIDLDDDEESPIHIYAFQPTVLNMEGQVGMYRAGGSLGFWDSDDSIAWSAINDFTDFEPSLTTLANTTKLQDQIGSITTIQPHGDGFMVYCTRSILYALEQHDAPLRYQTTVVLGNVGVAYPREVAVSEPDTTHFCFTSAGVMIIENGQAEPIIPDFSDYIKRARLPQYMTILNNRYLCFQVMDPDFIPGNIEYSRQSVNPEDWTYEGSEVGGVHIPEETIPGREVCFTVPGGPDDGFVDSGIKPYHLLQFYNQWLYHGASVTTNSVELVDEELDFHRVDTGDTDARYDVVPVTMSADEVPGFNAFDQIDALAERQREIYEEMYAETRLHTEERWTDYSEFRAKGGVSGEPRYFSDQEIDEVVVVDNAPDSISAIGNAANPFNIVSTLYEDDTTFTKIADYIHGKDDELYVQHTDQDTSSFVGDFQVLSSEAIQEALPDLPDLVGRTDEEGDYVQSCYQWVGYLNEFDWQPHSPDEYPRVRDLEVLDELSDITHSREREELEREDTVDEPLKLIPPEAVDEFEPRLAAGSLNAYKVAGSNTIGYEITPRQLKTKHVVFRRTASRVTLDYRETPLITYDTWNREQVRPNPHFIGRIAAYDEDGSFVGDIEKDESYSQTETLPYQETITSPVELDWKEAEDIMFDKSSDAYDTYTDQWRGALTEEWLSLKSEMESQALAIPGASSTSWESLIQRPDFEDDPDVSNSFYTVRPPNNSHYNAYRDIHFPCVYIDELLLEEEEYDFMEDLYGSVPADLPTGVDGTTAINAMSEETKRGLIAVYEHFYNNNNSKEEPDESFLITQAGRELVEIGTPLGEDEDVITNADFANRWYILPYEGAELTDESGNSIMLPGHTEPQQTQTAQQRVVCGTSEDIIVDEYVRDPIVYPPWTIEVPELTWVMQNGNRAPFNPTMYGAYVYDLHLQKWGVLKGEFKHLMDYQPVNNYSPGSVPYKNFMVDGGALTPEYEVVLFTDYPEDNLMRYGKFQHVAAEVNGIEQVIADFRTECSGIMSLQYSLDGRSLEYGHSVAEWYNNALSVTLNCDIVGKWATIAFTGHFDLAALRIKSNPSGRR